MKIVLSCRVAAFRTTVDTYYALFQSGYDASESAPAPRTTCVAFGTISQVLGWIFASLGDYEIGFARGPDGLISPEQCLTMWHEALMRPDRLFTQPVWLDATSGGEATIPTSSPVWLDGNMLPHAVKQLAEHGYDAVAKRVSAGNRVVVDLHRDACVLAGIYGYDARWPHIAPWRIVQPHGEGAGDESLAPSWRWGMTAAPALSAFRLDDTNCLMLRVRRGKSLFGSPDALFQSYANTIALGSAKLSEDGGLRALTAFREAIDGDLPAIEAGTGIVVYPRLLIGGIGLSTLATLKAMCGPDVISLPSGDLVLPVDVVRQVGAMAGLARLPGFAMSFACRSRMRRMKHEQPELSLAA